MATETNAPAAAAPAVPATKPTKPDEDVFKKELAKLEKEHKAALDQYVSAFLSVGSIRSEQPATNWPGN